MPPQKNVGIHWGVGLVLQIAPQMLTFFLGWAKTSSIGFYSSFVTSLLSKRVFFLPKELTQFSEESPSLRFPQHSCLRGGSRPLWRGIRRVVSGVLGSVPGSAA
uniref:Uncharacterized protein n=1 Tax=Gopherus evgoodei TaxID=1825980 RepID=A0A8C4Y0U4_9SAUR